MHRNDPDTRMAMRIEGGPEVLTGSLERAQEALENNSFGSKYSALHDTFGGKGEDEYPLEGWDEANLTEFLRCTIGPASDFVADYDAMTVDERAEKFPDPFVAELVEVWAQSGREPQ